MCTCVCRLITMKIKEETVILRVKCSIRVVIKCDALQEDGTMRTTALLEDVCHCGVGF